MGVGHVQQARKVEAAFESSTDRFLYLEVCQWADAKGIVRIPQNELALTCLLSPRTVARSFANLEQLGLLKKLGHGRYAIRLTLAEAPPVAVPESKPATKLDPAEAELRRLQSIRRDDQDIRYTPKGWPVLVENTAPP